MNKETEEYKRVREEVAFLSFQLHYRHYWKKEVYRLNWNAMLGWEKAQYHGISDQILSIPGIAILAENQKLPATPYVPVPDVEWHKKIAYEEGHQDMLQANFRKIV